MKMKFLIIVFLLSYCMMCDGIAKTSPWYFTPSDVNALHRQPANYRISYGKDPLQFGELRLPQGKGPFPVAMIIHGGCWNASFATIQNTGALADALRNRGVATWNIEYRRADNPGGGFPGTFQDVGQAADFLRQMAPNYALDLNNLIVIGHSAGGHLALWVAARDRLLSQSVLYTKEPIKFRGVMALGGVPNLKAFRKQGEKTCGSDVVGKLLGPTSDKIEQRYKQVSPSELVPLHIPQILIYGDEDQSVPKEFGLSYQQAARKKRDDVKVITVKYAGHHEYLVPNAVTWPSLLSSIEKLLNQKL